MNFRVIEIANAIYGFVRTYHRQIFLACLMPAALHLVLSVILHIQTFDALASGQSGKDQQSPYFFIVFFKGLIVFWMEVRAVRFRLLGQYNPLGLGTGELSATFYAILYSLFPALVFISMSILLIPLFLLIEVLGIPTPEFLFYPMVMLLLLAFILLNAGYLVAMSAVALGAKPNVIDHMLFYTKGITWPVFKAVILSCAFILPSWIFMGFTNWLYSDIGQQAGAVTNNILINSRFGFVLFNGIADMLDIAGMVMMALFFAEIYDRIEKLRPMIEAPRLSEEARR